MTGKARQGADAPLPSGMLAGVPVPVNTEAMTPRFAAASSPAQQVLWHALSPEDAFEGLSSGPGGLSAADSSRRLADTGPNELRFAGATPWWRVLLRQFISPLIGILLAAAVVTVIQQHWVDSAAIFLVRCRG